MLFLVLPSLILTVGKDFQRHFCHHQHLKATTKLFENLLPNLEFNSKAELVTDLNVWLPLTKLMAFADERPGEIRQQ
jgi:hypothetical protein